MLMRLVRLAIAFPALVISSTSAAYAQTPDAVGVRARGMAGAFTAVADDATATWWNPAGLATGPYLSLTLDYGREQEPDRSQRGFAIAFPALGLSYFHHTVLQGAPAGSPTGSTTPDRQDLGTLSTRSLEVSQFGATVGQSLNDHVVVASTVKLLRAAGESHADLDLGVLGAVGVARIGLMARNVRETTFGDGEAAMTFERQLRAGIAVTSAARTSYGGATLAADFDLLQVAGPSGDERRIAVGGELWTKARRLGIRGGLSGSTVGARRSSRSVGGSVALRQSFYLDGQLTGGDDVARRGWTAGLRVTF